MRYANQLRLQDRIRGELPTAKVTAAYDGPSGYVVIVDVPNVGSTIVRTEADWRRLQNRFKKLAMS